MKMMKFLDFFYNGEDPNFQDAIKMKFLALSKSHYVPPSLCPRKQCIKDKISVFVGAKGKYFCYSLLTYILSMIILEIMK